MKTITPREFRNAFVTVMKEEHQSFRTAVGFEAKSYAYFMRSNIFPKVAKHLGLLAWNKEYYALNGMFYEERGRDNFGNYAPYAKWISVALEHENKLSKTHEALNKLQSYNVPLKVMITYAAEGAEADSMLRKYEVIMSSSDVFNDFATLRKQLVIFGTPKTVSEWRFYAYESDGFVLMLPA
ncbi:MAG TPA: hypothetical protein VNW26_11645 [Steroidobacteraceae bacterium]|nr:hypothetical protein [Steroidobacteraceae bacterium]